MKRICSPKLTENANADIITKTGANNEAGYEIGMTAKFVCHSGFYHPKDWRQSSVTVICLRSEDNKSQKWQPIDGSPLTSCVKGKVVQRFQNADIKKLIISNIYGIQFWYEAFKSNTSKLKTQFRL